MTGSSALPKGLHLRLRLDTPSIKASPVGGSRVGTLVLRNEGGKPFRMESEQPIIALIVRPGTKKVVGTYVGAIAGTGLIINVSRGQHAVIPVLVGTRRCDGRGGPSIPPGTYGVRAGIGSETGPWLYLAPEIHVRIEQ